MPPGGERGIPWVVAVNAALFFAGAALCLWYPIHSVALAAAAVLTALRFATRRGDAPPRRGARLLAWLAPAVLLGFHAVVSYLLVCFGTRLAWGVPLWIQVLVALLVAAKIATFRSPFKIPLALPAGIWIIASLTAWFRGEGFARCDDYLRVRDEPGVEILHPPAFGLDECKPREAIPISRFPRRLWEAADGQRLVVTTTRGNWLEQQDRNRLVYNGLFCEAAADGTGRPRCIGGDVGKGSQIEEVAALDELVVCAYGLPSSNGRKRSAVFRLSRRAPLEILREHEIDEFATWSVYVAARDEFRFFVDSCGPIKGFRAADSSPVPDFPAFACPGGMQYDPVRDEGFLCGGVTGTGAAFRLADYEYRPLGAGSPFGWLTLSWGCDWDQVGRKVYVTSANLGLLLVIDYDSGRIERSHFVGFLLRSVAFDAGRQRVYIADFLGGDVIALDAQTGSEVGRWFVGRFIRDVVLSRDGNALLATSNLGIARIRLDG